MQPKYKPVAPDQQIRELRTGLKALQKEEPSPERAERLAAFARAAHDARQLNMAMHTAALCLEEDPDAPALLIAAYEPDPDTDPEEALRAWADLQDLARYVDQPDVRDLADERIRSLAAEWMSDADTTQTRHRYRTLASMFDRRFADEVRDATA